MKEFQKQLQMLRLTTPEPKKTFGAPFAQHDRAFQADAWDGADWEVRATAGWEAGTTDFRGRWSRLSDRAA